MDAPPPVERDLAFDMVKHGLLLAPVVVVVAGLVSGWDGTASAAIAFAIVCVNFTLAAVVVGWAAKMGPAAVGGAALGGYIFRLALILVALGAAAPRVVDRAALVGLHVGRRAPRAPRMGDALRQSAAGLARAPPARDDPDWREMSERRETGIPSSGERGPSGPAVPAESGQA